MPFQTWLTAIPLAAASVLVGCQTYERSPLDLEAFRADLDHRALEDPTPLEDFDPEDGISCAEGEVLALFYNPDLRIARAQAGVALATADTAGLWKDPVFGFDAAEVVNPSGPFEFGLMASLTIPISGRLALEKDFADADYAATLLGLVDLEWKTRAEVRRVWARWTTAVANAEAIKVTIAQLDSIDVIADSLETAGELNRVERRLLRIELADRTIDATESTLDLIETNTALLRVLGLPPSAAGKLQPALPRVEVDEPDDAIAQLLARNTLLAAHKATYHAAEEALRLEVRKQYPDLVLGTGYGKEASDHKILFGVSIPIPILNANRAGIAKATARRNVARAETETTTAQLLRELAAAQAVYATRRTQHEEYEATIVPLLEAQAKDITRIADLGELDMFVLLETTDRTLEARKRLNALREAKLDAAITLFQLLGPPLGDAE
jgi:cobalt-zinc-cadmium efflux system outer membrane protein